MKQNKANEKLRPIKINGVAENITIFLVGELHIKFDNAGVIIIIIIISTRIISIATQLRHCRRIIRDNNYFKARNTINITYSSFFADSQKHQ